MAGTVRDAAGVNASPGAVAIAGSEILAAGDVDSVKRTVGSGVHRVDLPDRLLIPGLVNAHTHLDLTCVGHRPYGGSFVEWIRMIIEYRRKGYPIDEAITRGGILCWQSGVMSVGDISPIIGSDLHEEMGLRVVHYWELLGSGLWEGFNFFERFGGRAHEMEGMRVRPGFQPHAPYSTGPSMYRNAAELSVRQSLALSTHLAETREEVRFIAQADGPFRELLQSMNQWEIQSEGNYGHGQHPVEWLFHNAPAPWLCAHCNYVEDSHIAMLAAHHASVAYCPRASEYFGHKNHRYREMIEAGVNVCLGTDSIICHGTLSILDEMRRLYQRDKTDPGLLLKMATVNGMRGLQLDEADATFAPEATPGVVSIRYDPRSEADALTQVLGSKDAPEIEVLEGIA